MSVVVVHGGYKRGKVNVWRWLRGYLDIRLSGRFGL